MYKIYISGAISNNPNYKKDFTEAKKILTKLGYEVLSPIETNASKQNLPIKFCMFEALDMLKQADFITFITDGKHSKGMNIEHALAEYCHIPIINYQLLKESVE